VQSLSVGQTVEGALGPNLIQYFAFNVTSSLATIGMLEVEPWARGYYWYRVNPRIPPARHAVHR
jgi:hypothetical protein